MSDNVDDFLRQAAQRRAQRQQQKNAPPPPPTRTPPTSSDRPRQSFPSPNSAKKQEPVVAELVPEVRSTVGNLKPSLLARHVESDLAYADERMDSHLKEAFSSNFQSGGRSTLRPSEAMPSPPSATPKPPTITSVDLKEQLRNPQTLRLAILAQQILNRPYS
jgi:hypothetical protein